VIGSAGAAQVEGQAMTGAYDEEAMKAGGLRFPQTWWFKPADCRCTRRRVRSRRDDRVAGEGLNRDWLN